jgi:hypothetical protein
LKNSRAPRYKSGSSHIIFALTVGFQHINASCKEDLATNPTCKKP